MAINEEFACSNICLLVSEMMADSNKDARKAIVTDCWH
jgi:hypothetical protein